jgi:hypothetical protein
VNACFKHLAHCNFSHDYTYIYGVKPPRTPAID